MSSSRFMFKATVVAALATVMAIGFVAQSSSNTVFAQATAAPTAAPTATPTPLPSVEGSLTIWVDPDKAPGVQLAADAFTKKTNIQVRIQTIPFGNIRDQFTVAGPAGNGPDILVAANDWIGQWSTNGLLSTLDLGDKAKSFDPVALKAFSYAGNLVGMPYLVEAVALYYNTDLVPTAPATWDDLKKVAKQLQDDKKVDQGYVLQAGDPYHTYPIFTGFGGYVFGTNADGSYNPKDVGLDSAGAIAGAQELDAMVKAGLLRDGIDYNTMTSLFKSGKGAMVITGPWELNNFRAVKGLNFNVAKMPTINGKPMRPFVGSQGFVVNKLSKNELLAKTFLTDYMASTDSFQAMYAKVAFIPAWLPMRSTVTDKQLLTFGDSVADGQPLPAIPEMGSVWDAWTKSINLIFSQKQAPDQAMKDAAQAIRDKIAGK